MSESSVFKIIDNNDMAKKENEIKVLMYFQYLYRKYSQDKENFEKFGAICMELAAELFGYDLIVKDARECYPPKSVMDGIKVAFSLTDSYLSNKDLQAKEMCAIILRCIEITINENEKRSIEREVQNLDIIMRMGPSNVRFIDNGWPKEFLDYNACMRIGL